MTLLREAEVPRNIRVQKFARGRFSGLVFSIAILGAASAIGWIGQRDGRPIFWLFAALGAGLFLPFALHQARSAWRSSNWLLLMASDGLYLKYRSYLNSHLPKSDATVCFIPRSEVASMRKFTQMEPTLSSGRGKASERRATYLEVLLNGSDTEPFRAALAAERQRRREGGGGFKAHDYPARLADASTIRISWDGIRPRASEALRLLAREYEIAPEENGAARDINKLEGRELEDYLLDLAERGRNMEAVKVARARYGWPLAEAKKFVDELTSGSRPR